jgi:tRNA modification GTPase
MIQSETICAIATAPGSAAIALIRVSGSETFSIVSSIFQSAKKTFSLNSVEGNTIHFGKIVNSEIVIDEVLLSVFKAPHSYTSEDSCEITCHASPYIQKEIIKLLISKGARLAQPGEYTMRAFMNGKMDLSQAEAVADLIASQSEAAHRLALSQLRGGYAITLSTLRDKLLKFSSLIELELDFSEEDVEFADRKTLLALCDEIKETLTGLVESFSTGNAVKNGISVAIVGEPNVGKSTLLNALLNEERAIVSEIPGTTRDTIEDLLTIQGVMFRFIDTAGIRHTTDSIEKIGIKKTYEKIAEASIILLLVDAKDSIEVIENRLTEVKSKILPKSKICLLLNKIDTVESKHIDFLLESLQEQNKPEDIITISAKQGVHIKKLKDSLVETVNLGVLSQHDSVVTNARHYEALSHALESIIVVENGLQSDVPGDLVSIDIKQVLYYLGSITGQITNDETLGFIFHNFCIGK